MKNYPPGPKTRLPGGALWQFRKDPIAFFKQLLKYGDISHFHLLGHDTFFINHPDYIKDALVLSEKFVKGPGLKKTKILLGEGLLTSDGEFHRRQRRLSQPAFMRKSVDSYGTCMIEHAISHQQHWQNGEVVDISKQMMALTMAIAANIFFDADLRHKAEEVGEALETIMNMVEYFVLSPFSEIRLKLPLPSTLRLKKAIKRLDDTIHQVISHRRSMDQAPQDLLSLLLNARDEEGDGQGMSDRQLRDEVMTLFIAGHETTANALAWTWYLLALHPEVEKKLHHELDSVLAGEPPVAANYKDLPYTQQVLREAMRLYPPAWLIGRQVAQSHNFGEYEIRQGSIVMMCTFWTHRDPRYYQDPEKFIPERWQKLENLPKFAYFPFGGGTRKCIGEHFAWLEGVLLIAAIAQKWRMYLIDREVTTLPRITLRSKNGIKMRLESRI